MTAAIAWFQELARTDSATAGGKGANLGELVGAGLPVPPGFVITARGYLSAMEEGGVRDELRSAFSEACRQSRDPAALTAAAEHLRSLVRKAFEFTLAPLAELTLSKQRILELYLNVIEWGPGIYGVDQAARYHYGVPPAGLNREQAARLAACIPAPRTRKPARMNQYAAVILDRMERRGW